MLLKENEMVKGIPDLIEPESVCPQCQMGKQHKENMSKQRNWRATRKLKLVHSDLCGPITLESNSKMRSFISFIDDFNRKCWIYFLAEKSSAFEVFKRFKIMVEKEIQCSFSCLRIDRGGEFNSNEFNDFSSVNGIRRQLIAAFTPQQRCSWKEK